MRGRCPDRECVSTGLTSFAFLSSVTAARNKKDNETILLCPEISGMNKKFIQLLRIVRIAGANAASAWRNCRALLMLNG